MVRWVARTALRRSRPAESIDKQLPMGSRVSCDGGPPRRRRKPAVVRLTCMPELRVNWRHVMRPMFRLATPPRPTMGCLIWRSECTIGKARGSKVALAARRREAPRQCTLRWISQPSDKMQSTGYADDRSATLAAITADNPQKLLGTHDDRS
jgi:hypothetical protein